MKITSSQEAIPLGWMVLARRLSFEILRLESICNVHGMRALDPWSFIRHPTKGLGHLPLVDSAEGVVICQVADLHLDTQ